MDQDQLQRKSGDVDEATEARKTYRDDRATCELVCLANDGQWDLFDVTRNRYLDDMEPLM